MIPCGTVKWDEKEGRPVAERGIAIDRQGRMLTPTLLGSILLEWSAELAIRKPRELYPDAPWYDMFAPDRVVGVEPPPHSGAVVVLLVEGRLVIKEPRLQDVGEASLVWLRRGETLKLERRAWLGFCRRRFGVTYEGAGDIDTFERDVRVR
jgi:hypothetical protein